jgi:hypothetical protein
MDEYEGLTSEDICMMEFGEKAEQIRWLASIIQTRNPILEDRKNIYKAAGVCLKRYGFQPTVLAFKHITTLSDEHVFSQLMYACSSYNESIKSKQVGAETAANIGTILSNQSMIEQTHSARQSMLDPQAYVLTLFCDGVVTKEQYEECEGSPEKCTELIRKVKADGTS